ncbi:hypothetical protein JXA12_02570 [Candidatus Woesearchaeota archaeon]|nr:hypothetical protein [Candidatus Woesearchaeota archaeon]
MKNKRWRGVKAQATLFVILGIVLLAVFSFALYARGLLVQQRYQEQAKETVTAFINTNNIEHYVQECLREVSDHAFVYVGEHGGGLDTTWAAGEDYLRYAHEGEARNVGYALIPNKEAYCEIYEENPEPYPKARTYAEDLLPDYLISPCRYDRLSGLIGYHSLQKLCYAFGENSFAATPTSGSLPCPPMLSSGGENNIQSWLQRNITEELKKCVDIDDFFLDTEQGIAPHEDLVEAKVIYSFEGTHVVAEYPFDVTVGSGRQIRTVKDFSYASPVRLRAVYEYASALAAKEARDIFFNLTRDYDQLNEYREQFEITLVKDPCLFQPENCFSDTEHDDVLIIHDHQVNILGKPYEFAVALKNRRPVLDWLHSSDAGSWSDFRVDEGDVLTLTPQGYDPDDGRLTYQYAGWKETYDDVFDREQWEADWAAAVAAGTTGDLDLREYVERVEDAELEATWTSSEPFSETGKDASYGPFSPDDLGFHDVIITTTDNSGLKDFQTVSILVFDLPFAVANGTNGFDDIPDRFASIEDQYWLDARDSRSSAVLRALNEDPSLSLYEWEGKEDGVRDFLVEFGQARVRFPEDVTSDDPQVAPPASKERMEPSIDSGEWSYAPYATDGGNDITDVYFKKTGPYSLSLRVFSAGAWSEPDNVQGSDGSGEEFYVLACLPTKGGEGMEGVPPYPYTAFEEPYPHVCCGGDLDDPDNVKPISGIVCYSRTLHTTPLFFNLDKDAYGTIESIKPDNTIYEYVDDVNGGTLTYSINNYLYENDPFVIAIERECDGERGNTCTGDVTITYTRLDDCADYAPGTVERCQGPNTNFDSCINYPQGSSFEKEYELDKHDSEELADGICSGEPRCAAGNGRTFNPQGDLEGPYLCSGACDGNGGCTRATLCSCDYSCGAECVAGEVEYDAATGTCEVCVTSQHVSPSIRCTMGERYCPQGCYSKNDVAYNPECLPTTYSPMEANYCLYDDTPCNWPQCSYDRSANLDDSNYCYACSSSGAARGDRCSPGEYDGVCYYEGDGSYTCTGSQCNLRTTTMPEVCVRPTGGYGTPVCDPKEGFFCT